MNSHTVDAKLNICGERIREARIDGKATQEDLAARVQTMGVQLSRQKITLIENGQRMLRDYELLAIAEALNVSPAYLLGIPEKPGRE